METQRRQKANHTPGPWYIEPLDGPCFIRSVDNVPVARTDVDSESYNAYESEANARLIAAAPELLEIVQRIAEHFADTDAPLGIAARAAIAKAAGEEGPK